MLSIEKSNIPNGGLLNNYAEKGEYADCFVTEISGTFSHEQFVMAFYTTWLFKLERFILKWVVSRPSTDNEAKQLAKGNIKIFAAWYVENRCENQLLLCDFQDRTRSWLMLEPLVTEGNVRTRLYFGSAIVSTKNKTTGTASLPLGFRLLLGFHKIYSVLLLSSAKSRLSKQ